MTSSIETCLWVKTEPLVQGVFPISPPSRMSISHLHKLINYAKTKGKYGFPKLSYCVWRHIACNKLELSSETAWMYFVTFNLLQEISSEERINWDLQYSKLTTQEEKEKLKGEVVVDTLQFTLFLFLQHMNKISLRASLSAEEWPMRVNCSDKEDRKSNSRKIMEEQRYLTFVSSHLKDILEFLVEPEVPRSYDSGGLISVDSLKALELILEGSVGLCRYNIDCTAEREVKCLHEIALLPYIQPQIGYNKVTKLFSFQLLLSWIHNSLGPNPLGISACVTMGKRLAWQWSGCCGSGREKSPFKNGRTATNVLFAPPERKLIILSQCSHQTIARSSATLSKSYVKIHRCHSSYIYLLSPLRLVSIEKCYNSTFILGPIATTLIVKSCHDITIIAVCRRLSICDLTASKFFVLTPNNPVLLGNRNDDIKLAPYHTFYPLLEDQMIEAGIGAHSNFWHTPICITADGHHDEIGTGWGLLNPKDFNIFNIPFHLEGHTDKIPGGLPTKYQKAIAQRERQILNWQRSVRAAGLTIQQRKEFQSIVEAKFQEWLSQTGHKKELDGLVSSVQAMEEGK